MTDRKDDATTDRWDRPSDHVARIFTGLPWTNMGARGSLDLARDGSQHRRYASMFEDLLN